MDLHQDAMSLGMSPNMGVLALIVIAGGWAWAPESRGAGRGAQSWPAGQPREPPSSPPLTEIHVSHES